MANLTAPRSTVKMPPEGVIPDILYLGVGAGATIWAGSIACINTSGYCVNGGAASLAYAVGRAEPSQNSAGTMSITNSGSNGSVSVQVRQGVFPWANSASTDLIAVTNIGQDCYVVDDQTVSLTDGNGTRVRAGKIVNVDAAGVWVLMGLFTRDAGNSVGGGAQAGAVITIPVTLSALANATYASFTPGFAGRVKSVTYVPAVISTTASKLATVQVQIGGVSATGGALSLTTAACGTLGTNVNGTAITAGNAFTAAQAISLLGSSVTAFVEGSGSFQIVLA